MQNKFIKMLIFFLISSFVLCSSIDYSGKVEYFYMARTSDYSVVNIPFRIFDFSVHHQNDNLDINGTLSMEYRTRQDTDFLTDSDLQDFTFDLRELYLTYYFDNSEIRVGKQLYNLGNVDENSPIDNLNPYDYYYLLLGGSEKKLGIYSLAYDQYFLDSNLKMSFVFSPLHNTSRFPVNDPQYPIGLPEVANPSKETIVLNDKSVHETAFSLKYSFDFGDLSISHLYGYDRNPNLSGISLYSDIAGDNFQIIPRYSYRLTNAYNFGGVFFVNNITIRFDRTEFYTEDRNNTNDLLGLDPGPLNDVEIELPNVSPPINQEINPPLAVFSESAHYYQHALQFEVPLGGSNQINMQYFKHKVYRYEANSSDLSCEGFEIPNFDVEECQAIESDLGISLSDFSPENLFIPGMGIPYTIIVPEGFLFDFQTKFLDDDLTLNFTAFIDASKAFHGDGKLSGNLSSLELEYDFGNGLNCLLGLTRIQGDEDIPNYSFNAMEDFSHIRTQFTYNF
ncbi:MAG: hypothetical protein CMG64_05775 [Candidatus Marinimicrobia bacterium]|nr:hypothetical protein [Candidatus Neomarinimicrobiota bacterium]|tara:strand:+ start:2505 stop:4025 length:1521 start_codon:yes stop_codon:yes gene_type:complete